MLHDTGETVIHYDLLGSPDAPLVCMTHSLTSDSGMWAEQVPALLNAGYQVLRIDARGHGGSSAPAGLYTIEDLARDVLSVLDTLGFASGVHLIGLSMGGMIGQVIAANHPGRLASLMVCCTASRWEGDNKLMLDRLAAVKAARSLESIVASNMERRYGSGFRERRPTRWEALRQTFLSTKLEGFFGCMNAVLNHDVLDRLSAVKVPSMVVAGTKDQTTPPESNKLIAETIPCAKYAEITDGYHFPNIEFDSQFNRLMLEWLATVRG
ncbi:alpha/beta fold hydrolase [Rhizobium leguminosarum]|uniref:alpha/beta fold hydrolase n=1 Tax=Rhizobium leguminosarum TaxID=384 RepID=UPI0024A9416E|nr:alpha/beta fold hydrolase [Rhizobium leguminosarum]MDI5930003.1 alpha/beta fold hydrolase [Rhizobium leguminosarum]